MSTLPPVLVVPVRAALVSQGFPGGVIRNDGTFDFSLLASSTYDTVEVWSNASPPITMNVVEALRDDGKPPNPVLAALQPTVVLSGPRGKLVIAPFGTARRDGAWKGAAVVVGGVLGLMWLGRALA